MSNENATPANNNLTGIINETVHTRIEDIKQKAQNKPVSELYPIVKTEFEKIADLVEITKNPEYIASVQREITNTITETIHSQMDGLQHQVKKKRIDYEMYNKLKKEFGTMINLAKLTNNDGFVSTTYDEMATFYEKNNQLYAAVEILIEAKKFDKAMVFLTEFINPPSNNESNESGALELAKRMGPAFVEQIEAQITKKEDALNTETRKKLFREPQSLSDICYATESGSLYRVNQNNMLFRNGEPFITEGTAYSFFGIGDPKIIFQKIVGFAFYTTKYNRHTEGQVAFLANDHTQYDLANAELRYRSDRTLKHPGDEELRKEYGPFITPMTFAEVNDYLDGKVALIGFNEKIKEFCWTSPITTVKKIE